MAEARRDPPTGKAPGADADPDARRAPGVPLKPFRVAYHGRKPFRSARKPPLGTRYLPLLASLRGYSRSRLRTDALAGITVAALALQIGRAHV